MHCHQKERSSGCIASISLVKGLMVTLASHLARNGDLLGHYLWRRGTRTAGLAHAANQRLRAAPLLRPARGEHYPWATTARAFEYLARMELAPLPWKQLPAVRGAAILIREHGDLFTAPELRAWFGDLQAALQHTQPSPARSVAGSGSELARYAYTLGLLEEVTQSRLYTEGPLFHPAPRTQRGDLLAIASEEQVDDLVQLLPPFRATFAPLRHEPMTLYPFADHALRVLSEDRSLVIGGHLVALKTTVEPHITAADLRYLLGCALLDAHEALHLTSVGWYLSRQGMWLEWPLTTFIAEITGQPEMTLPQLRAEFDHLLKMISMPLASRLP